jgi:hypothetical protein
MPVWLLFFQAALSEGTHGKLRRRIDTKHLKLRRAMRLRRIDDLTFYPWWI